MTKEFDLAKEFGPRLADGIQAADFREKRVEPSVNTSDETVLDFSGVRIANSSFINALIAGIIEHLGPQALERLVFKGCNPTLKVLVEGAISLGVEKSSALRAGLPRV